MPVIQICDAIIDLYVFGVWGTRKKMLKHFDLFHWPLWNRFRNLYSLTLLSKIPPMYAHCTLHFILPLQLFLVWVSLYSGHARLRDFMIVGLCSGRMNFNVSRARVFHVLPYSPLLIGRDTLTVTFAPHTFRAPALAGWLAINDAQRCRKFYL